MGAEARRVSRSIWAAAGWGGLGDGCGLGLVGLGDGGGLGGLRLGGLGDDGGLRLGGLGGTGYTGGVPTYLPSFTEFPRPPTHIPGSSYNFKSRPLFVAG